MSTFGKTMDEHNRDRTEAQAIADREKREADYIAREAVRLEQMQFNRLFGGVK